MVLISLTHRHTTDPHHRLLNLCGINSLLVWMSCAVASLRFRYALRAQQRALTDLPFRQPLFPLLPVLTLILGTVMLIAQGYAAVALEPFEARNVIATYIGFATFVLLYVGYALFERFRLGKTRHFVDLREADVDTDAVWGPGRVRRDAEELVTKVEGAKRAGGGRAPVWRRVLGNFY
jgi:amino acid permease